MKYKYILIISSICISQANSYPKSADTWSYSKSCTDVSRTFANGAFTLHGNCKKSNGSYSGDKTITLYDNGDNHYYKNSDGKKCTDVENDNGTMKCKT
jgi:hypothetical protein